MHPVEDNELLRAYVERGSEEAFATLVSRHVNMVYSVALRTVGNPDHAQEVAQVVFLVFARKARSLGPRTVVGGWLFHAARLTASNFVRNEVRRRRREQEVYMQSQHHEQEADAWAQIAPMLDGAIGSLGASDRNAVVLRFLEGRELREVGRAIGASEEGARKRVHRALEKLRKFFTRRGIILSGSVLASAIAANSATAAPSGLATSITALGALKGATAGASTLALIQGTLKALAWAKLKLAAGIGAGVALATGTAIVAVTYVAQAAHTPVKAPTLSPNSPFVRHLSNPPWIKKMEFAHGAFAGPGFLNTNNPPPAPTWAVITNTFGVQPSGSYFMLNSSKPGIRTVAGLNDKYYWSAQEKPKWVKMTPVAPDASYFPSLEGMKPRMEELRHLGLRALRPGTFAMHEDGSFTATTFKDEALEGKILKVSNDRPLALTYHVLTSLSQVQSREFTVNITYQYASATAQLPESFGYSETARDFRQGNGVEMIEDLNRGGLLATNYILSADYGLDESISNGYSPSMFFPDVGQYQVHIELISNGVLYIDGIARPSPGTQIGGPGAVTNRAGK